MPLLRFLCLPLLGVALSIQSAVAQTAPTPLKSRKPTSRPTLRTADPLRGSNHPGTGRNVYAAPGQPVNIQSNGKNTPPYDGPAAGHAAKDAEAARAKTSLATPK